MKNMKKSFLLGIFLGLTFVALFFTASFLQIGCAPENARNSRPKMLTDQIIEYQWIALYIPRGASLDSSYAVISDNWLTWALDSWKTELFNAGVNDWEERFDCNRFALDFIVWCNRRYYVDNFHSRVKAQAPAIFLFCYLTRPELKEKSPAHALIAAITEKGVVYVDTQSKQRVKLTPEQIVSRFIPAL